MTARLNIAGGPILLAGALVLAATVGLASGIRPEVAIAASLAVAFVVIVIADLAAGLAVFTFLALLEIVPFGGSLLSFSKLLGLLLLISWLAVMSTQRGLAVDRAVVRPASFLLVGLLVWVALSATWAERPDTALVAFSRYLLNAVLFVIVLTSVRERSTVIQVLAAFAAGAGAAAAYGFVSPDQFDTDFGRLESAALDPNELAAILVPGFVICLFAAVGMRARPLLRVAAGLVGGLCLATTVLTVSRGGLIALVVALVVGVLVAGRWRVWIALVAVTIAASGYVYFAGFASDETVEHIESTTQGDVRLQEGRVTIWQVAWRMVEDNPVRGVGAGNFANSSVHYVLEPGQAPRSDLILDTPSVAHNTYLGALAELGVIGLTFFLALVGFCLVSLARAIAAFKRIGDTELELAARALLVALTGILAADFFISEEFSKALWLLLGLSPGMLVVARRIEGKGAKLAG